MIIQYIFKELELRPAKFTPYICLRMKMVLGEMSVQNILTEFPETFIKCLL